MTSATDSGNPDHPAEPALAEPAGAGAADPAPAPAWTDWDGLPDLVALAAEFGVATSYVGSDGRPVVVAPSTVRAVLTLLGVDPTDPAAALAAARRERARRLAPPCAVVRAPRPAPVPLHLPPGTGAEAETGAEAAPEVEAELVLADGRTLAVDVGPLETGPAAPAGRAGTSEGAGMPGTVGTGGTGAERAASTLVARLPAGLPLGDHLLRVRAGEASARCQVIAVPDQVPDPLASASDPDGPAAGAASRRRAWGWMIQLYAITSAGSWGMGDYADLAMLAEWSGQAGADVLLVNPLHAPAPISPLEASPYSPASRRFASPLYLRPELTPEYARADAPVRARVDELAEQARRTGIRDGLIDRDAIWTAKRAALELLFAHSGFQRPDGVPGEVDAGGSDAGGSDAGRAGAGGAGAGALRDFATWCALAERHGRDWRAWPEPLRHPRSAEVAAARAELADRVAFHTWLQLRCDDQLTAAQAAARAAGMRVGIMHDLAVGVDPGGADAWALRDVLATGASVGAPPDAFNQQGQDWGLPPWHPTALVEAGYAPLREMVAAVLARGGGLRVDHILGLFRLWWIPAGAGAANGTYVRYDADAMLGLLALEAHRAGALVVGEDLGTVEPSVAGRLAEAGVLGSSVLWFEKAPDGTPLPPERYRPRTLASVTTHDLPTAAGYLDGEHVRLRARLGLLTRPEEDERADWLTERARLLRLLVDEGLLDPTAAGGQGGRGGQGGLDGQGGLEPGGCLETEDRLDPALRDAAVLGLHALLVRSPARVVLAAPGDALGDRRQPNLPGTVDSYPNWRLPAADDQGRPITVERLRSDERVRRLAALLSTVTMPPS